MKPDRCKHDWEVAAAVEKWKEKYRIIEEEDGEAELREKYRMTALRGILVGDIKKHIELREDDIKTYEQMKEINMKWAVPKRMEKKGATHPWMWIKQKELKEKRKVIMARIVDIMAGATEDGMGKEMLIGLAKEVKEIQAKVRGIIGTISLEVAKGKGMEISWEEKKMMVGSEDKPQHMFGAKGERAKASPWKRHLPSVWRGRTHSIFL